ncbi:MAG: hypothetical protein D8M58_16560 [Calditrichaeota bacterium]|nr:MAG: hypothetical protein DWQ03_08290 [Calditrichota bacterium]MBL1207018.1 hypothetical protein [Calditrichota bacterium]NOG46845.1 hypothetical protein [Calditrichota bacterium]
MSSLVQFIKYEILLILIGFIVVIIFQVFNGRINLQSLLRDKKSRKLSSGRMQQLFFTLIISLHYLYLTFKNPSAFPEIEQTYLYLLAGSGFVYLGGKARSIGWLVKKYFR